jgi:hypothetical protein
VCPGEPWRTHRAARLRIVELERLVNGQLREWLDAHPWSVASQISVAWDRATQNLLDGRDRATYRAIAAEKVLWRLAAMPMWLCGLDDDNLRRVANGNLAVYDSVYAIFVSCHGDDPSHKHRQQSSVMSRDVFQRWAKAAAKMWLCAAERSDYLTRAFAESVRPNDNDLAELYIASAKANEAIREHITKRAGDGR